MDHILVIDDDRDLVDLVREYLEPEGFTVDGAFNHGSGLQRALAGGHELVVLDVMLPGGSGFDLLKKLRTTSNLPVLLLTARGDAVDRIVGLEIGADDYLPKPFEPRELVARIRAILRRSRQAREGDDEEDEIRVGDVRLSLRRRTVLAADAPLDVTAVEFNLLECLLRHAGTIVSRDVLAEKGMGRRLAPFDRSVDVHVSKLRRKLADGTDGEERIKTIRGAGYLYVPPPSPAKRG
jgi:two-component system response regulator CpxR